MSLTQSLLQQSQLIATQNHKKPSLKNGVFIWHFWFPSFQEGFSVHAWLYLGQQTQRASTFFENLLLEIKPDLLVCIL